MAKVTIRIRNGVAGSIEGIPTDMFIEVRNYDVGNATEDQLAKDTDGTPCQVKEWHSPE